MTDTTIRKTQKRSQLVWKKHLPGIQKGRPPTCVHMRLKYEVKLSYWNSRNWAGHDCNNAACSRQYLFSDGNRFFKYFLMVTNWAVQPISRISLCLHYCLHQNSPWSGTSICGAVIRILSQNVGKKSICFSFLGYLDEIESDSQNVWTCMYTIVPGPVLPIFKS